VARGRFSGKSGGRRWSRFGGLNRFGGGGQDAACARGANPGTVTLFPANGAGNKVAVPGLRRIAASPKTWGCDTLGPIQELTVRIK
jgi:hypothetical protein